MGKLDLSEWYTRGYFDPTAGEAISRVMFAEELRTARAAKKLSAAADKVKQSKGPSRPAKAE